MSSSRSQRRLSLAEYLNKDRGVLLDVPRVGVSQQSITSQVRGRITNPFDAFNEYVWNAIDAEARNINIKVVLTQKHFIKTLEIIDDGTGVNYDELDKVHFGQFNASSKADQQEANHSLPHGHRGFGRFSFIFFADAATWNTVYKSEKDGKKYEYSITIDGNKLDIYEPTKLRESKKQGTNVAFDFGSQSQMETLTVRGGQDALAKLKDNILLEFAWVIELLNINIFVNDVKLDHSYLIQKKIDFQKNKINIDGMDFEIKFIKWAKRLKNQYSRMYLIDSKGIERYVETTKLNNKNDEFYHSIYVKSEFFDNYKLLETAYKDQYRKLMKFIYEFLKKQRKPFMAIFSTNKIKELEKKNLFPKFDKFEEKVKKPAYLEIVKDVIEFAPGLVAPNTNDTQKKVFLQVVYRLLDDEEERNTLYSILETLVDEDNRPYLAELDNKLKKYGLQNILGLMREVELRFETLALLKKMMGDDKQYYSESDLQKMIVTHYWIFGEEYNLMICHEEDDFNKLRDLYFRKALKLSDVQYKERLSGKQVDLFVTGVASEGQRRKNLIVEIKKPAHYLKKKDYVQIDGYKDIINTISEFNTPERDHWDYILLYTQISKDHEVAILGQIDDKFTGLCKVRDVNYRIFVKKWADLLRDVEDRLNFLKDHLNARKNKLLEEKKEKPQESAIEKFAKQKKREIKNVS